MWGQLIIYAHDSYSSWVFSVPQCLGVVCAIENQLAPCFGSQWHCSSFCPMEYFICLKPKPGIVIWDTLQDYGRIEWQLTPSNLRKKPPTLLIKMFLINLIRCGSQRSYNDPQKLSLDTGRALFLDVPSVCTGSPKVIVFDSFLTTFLFFYLCPLKNLKQISQRKKKWQGHIPQFVTWVHINCIRYI